MAIRRGLLVACLCILALSGPVIGQNAASVPQSASSTRVQIGNFGKINENYYRGAQPKASDYKDLALMGVRTVIDLQKDGRSDEQGFVEGAGMRFVRIPMTTTDRPTDAQVAQFLSIVNDPANQPVFVHCAGGRHRTGTMTAVFRMTQDGWTADRAYAEMKQFRFEGFPDHPVLRKFVYGYKPAPATPTVFATTVVGSN